MLSSDSLIGIKDFKGINKLFVIRFLISISIEYNGNKISLRRPCAKSSKNNASSSDISGKTLSMGILDQPLLISVKSLLFPPEDCWFDLTQVLFSYQLYAAPRRYDRLSALTFITSLYLGVMGPPKRLFFSLPKPVEVKLKYSIF